MTEKTKIRNLGGSLALIVPKSVSDAMAIKEGDVVFVSSSGEGMTVSPFDPEFASAMDYAR